MKKINICVLIIALLVPLLIGIISASISAGGMEAYKSMDKPPLSPPPWVFSVAWTILYLMMGLSSYLVLVANADMRIKRKVLLFYAIQLVLNFMWTIIFFNWGLYLFAFIWLLVMWLVVIFCALLFYTINRMAAYLLIPYIIWLSFAAYLNMGSYILNK